MSGAAALGLALWVAAPIAVLLARAAERRQPLVLWRRFRRVSRLAIAALSGLLVAVSDPLLAVPAATITWAVLVLHDAELSLVRVWSLRSLHSRASRAPEARAALRRMLGFPGLSRMLRLSGVKSSDLLGDAEEPDTNAPPLA